MPPKTFKPATSHGLEKRYKPHRKGTSAKHKGESKTAINSSLKNKLRSERRRLNMKNLPVEARAGIELSVKKLEAEIAGKNVLMKSRDNATKYHQVKFFERRKLMRLENKVPGLNDGGKGEMVVKEGFDYVKNYPTSLKYMSLFKDAGVPKKSDVEGTAQYALRCRLRATLEEVFGDLVRNPSEEDASPVHDNRFGDATIRGKDMLPKMAETDKKMAEAEKKKTEKKKPPPAPADSDSDSDSDSSSSSSSSSDSSDDDATPTPAQALLARQAVPKAPSSSSSDSEDDFLIPHTETENLAAVLEKVVEPRMEFKKGNKAEGWATQKGKAVKAPGRR